MKRIEYSARALKNLRHLPANDRQRLAGKIMQLATEPQTLTNNIKRLQGWPGFRLRVGDYRVIFEISDDVLSIIDVDVRGNIYE